MRVRKNKRRKQVDRMRTDVKRTVQKSLGFVIVLVLLAGCATTGKQPDGGGPKQVLQVRWQRVVDAKGQTCDRCGLTEKAAEDGVKKLRRSLKAVGIEVVLEKVAVSSAEFSKDPLESNRMWIADKPIEEWLGATIGKSPCSGPCGVAECRTITVDGRTYTAIPSELIVKAGLLAGAQVVSSQPRNPWNPLGEWAPGAPACCPAVPVVGGK